MQSFSSVAATFSCDSQTNVDKMSKNYWPHKMVASNRKKKTLQGKATLFLFVGLYFPRHFGMNGVSSVEIN